MNCPKCNNENVIKHGKAKGKQRYLCKLCNYNYTVQTRSNVPSAEVKRQALELYLEGLGFRSIGRFLKVSHVAVYNWIKSFGENLEQIRSPNSVQVMELYEMHSYVGSKKTTAGYGLLLIEMKGNSSTALWAHVEQ